MMDARELHVWDMTVFLANHWRSEGKGLTAEALLKSRDASATERRDRKEVTADEFASMFLEPGEKLEIA